MNLSQTRIHTLDFLRGIAALAVTWFHFTNGQVDFLPNGPLKSSGAYGWAGVEIFFVISGFVIPYSLHRANYDLSSFHRFILKRVLRLDPPYLVSILIIIALAYLSMMMPGFRGAPFKISLPQLLLHLGYANVFFNYQWLNPVFWTLAIEFQYYLLIGLIFPLLKTSKVYVVMAGMAIITFLFPSDVFICHYLPLFMLGMMTFRLKAGLGGKVEYFGGVVALTVAVSVALGPGLAILGCTTALIIAYVQAENRVALFFGNISYSLYLLHVPIGGRIISLGGRFPYSLGCRLLFLLFALGGSVLASYILYLAVEKPAQRWASGIKYKPAPSRHSSLASEATGPASSPVL